MWEGVPGSALLRDGSWACPGCRELGSSASKHHPFPHTGDSRGSQGVAGCANVPSDGTDIPLDGVREPQSPQNSPWGAPPCHKHPGGLQQILAHPKG